MTTVLSTAWRKARKEHTCIWCGQNIEKGERYLDENVLGDNTVNNQKWHNECTKAAHEYFTTWGMYDDTFMPYSFKRGSVEER